MDFMGIMAGISQAVGMYKTAVEIKDETKIAAATHDLQLKLITAGAFVLQAQEKQSQAAEGEATAKANLRDAEERIRELERRIGEREKYDLVEPYPGTFTFRIKEAARGTEPLHYVCAACMDNRSMKSILQFSDSTKRYASCNECKAHYTFAESYRPSSYDF